MTFHKFCDRSLDVTAPLGRRSTADPCRVPSTPDPHGPSAVLPALQFQQNRVRMIELFSLSGASGQPMRTAWLWITVAALLAGSRSVEAGACSLFCRYLTMGRRRASAVLTSGAPEVSTRNLSTRLLRRTVLMFCQLQPSALIASPPPGRHLLVLLAMVATGRATCTLAAAARTC